MSRPHTLADDMTTATPAKKNADWELEPHICKKCFARLVSRPVTGSVSPGLRVYLCTNCGLEAEGTKTDAACCCGIKIRKAGRGGKQGALVDAGVRCIPNPEPSLMFPNLIIASEVAAR